MIRIFMLAALAMLIATPLWAQAGVTGNLPCAKGRIEGNGTYNPQIVLLNGCGDVVFWTMCINYPSKADNEYYEGGLQPGEEAWVETYPEAGEEFNFRVRYQITSPDVEYPAC